MKGEHATFKISEGCNLIFLKINQSINQSFILTCYVEELENSFKIRTCINIIDNNYSYVMILFNFLKQLNKYT